jgi:2-keto-3-deoxy-L-fuconate dehydrogenase
MSGAQFRLDEKIAVVTGAASGIGYAVAQEFRAAGARVLALDLGEEKVRETVARLNSSEDMDRAEVVGFSCDVADTDAVLATFEKIERGGGVDLLVNCAGIAHVGTIATTSPEEFDRLYRVNVRGTFLCMQAALRLMKRGGAVVNLASIAASEGLSDRFAYAMTKGAVLAMTLSVAKDYLASGIRCNCISPARIHTPFVDGFVQRNYPGREAEMMEKLSAAQPIGRMGTPEEVAWLAQYLCSDAASFVTGVDYPLDGGFFHLR